MAGFGAALFAASLCRWHAGRLRLLPVAAGALLLAACAAPLSPQGAPNTTRARPEVSACAALPPAAEQRACLAAEVLASPYWNRAAQLLVAEFETPLQRLYLDGLCHQGMLQTPAKGASPAPPPADIRTPWLDRCIEHTLQTLDPHAELLRTPTRAMPAAAAAQPAQGGAARPVAPIKAKAWAHVLRHEPDGPGAKGVQAVPPGTVYARLRALEGRATLELVDAVAQARAGQPGAIAGPLVLDLRGNAGGLLDEVLHMAWALGAPGTPVLAQNTRQSRAILKSEAPRWGRTPHAATVAYLRSAPLLVLVDKRTAVGAEALATALRTHRGARVVGEPTAAINTLRIVHGLGADRSLVFTNGRLFSASGPNWVPGGVPLDLNTAARNATPGADETMHSPFEFGLLPDDPVLAAALALHSTR